MNSEKKYIGEITGKDFQGNDFRIFVDNLAKCSDSEIIAKNNPSSDKNRIIDVCRIIIKLKGETEGSYCMGFEIIDITPEDDTSSLTFESSELTKLADKPIYIKFEYLKPNHLSGQKTKHWVSLDKIRVLAEEGDKYMINVGNGSFDISKETYENIQKVIEQHASVIKC